MTTFKKIPNEEKPRERLLVYGANNLSNEELLMIILKSGTKKKSVKDIAIDVLASINNIKDFNNLTINQLEKIEGIGKVKAIELAAIIEFSKRITKRISEKDMISCTSPETIINYFNDYLSKLPILNFYCKY